MTDTMIGGCGCGLGCTGPVGGRVHGVLLADKPSAKVPFGYTIPLGERRR